MVFLITKVQLFKDAIPFEMVYICYMDKATSLFHLHGWSQSLGHFRQSVVTN